MTTEIQKTIRRLKDKLDELASYPSDYDTCKMAVEIYHPVKLCPKCEADMDVWQDVFNERHHCV